MNKILEIPEGENIKYDKQAEKMQVYKQLCESLESRDRKNKKIKHHLLPHFRKNH